MEEQLEDPNKLKQELHVSLKFSNNLKKLNIILLILHLTLNLKLLK